MASLTQTLIPTGHIKDRDVSAAFDVVGATLASGADVVYTTSAATSGTTATAALMVGGAGTVVLNMTGTLGAGANLTTDTAANIIAALNNPVIGLSYTLRIINSSSAAFSWTVVAGSGVTLTGTATIAQNTWREYQVILTSLTAVTLQNIGTGTFS